MNNNYIPNKGIHRCFAFDRFQICEIRCVKKQSVKQTPFRMSAKRVLGVWHGKETKKYWNGEEIME